MDTYKVGYFVGSLSSTSINRVLSRALIRLAPRDLEFTEIPIGDLPLYSPDFDRDYPAAPQALKAAIAGSDAVLFVTRNTTAHSRCPEERHRLASRPWGQNAFDHMPAAVIGASPGQIGTAVGQQSLRAVLSFCNARQMTAPEAYITFKPGHLERHLGHAGLQGAEDVDVCVVAHAASEHPAGVDISEDHRAGELALQRRPTVLDGVALEKPRLGFDLVTGLTDLDRGPQQRCGFRRGHAADLVGGLRACQFSGRSRQPTS